MKPHLKNFMWIIQHHQSVHMVPKLHNAQANDYGQYHKRVEIRLRVDNEILCLKSHGCDRLDWYYQ